MNYCWKCCRVQTGIGWYHKLFPWTCPRTCSGGW